MDKSFLLTPLASPTTSCAVYGCRGEHVEAAKVAALVAAELLSTRQFEPTIQPQSQNFVFDFEEPACLVVVDGCAEIQDPCVVPSIALKAFRKAHDIPATIMSNSRSPLPPSALGCQNLVVSESITLTAFRSINAISKSSSPQSHSDNSSKEPPRARIAPPSITLTSFRNTSSDIFPIKNMSASPLPLTDEAGLRTSSFVSAAFDSYMTSRYPSGASSPTCATLIKDSPDTGPNSPLTSSMMAFRGHALSSPKLGSARKVSACVAISNAASPVPNVEPIFKNPATSSSLSSIDHGLMMPLSALTVLSLRNPPELNYCSERTVKLETNLKTLTNCHNPSILVRAHSLQSNPSLARPGLQPVSSIVKEIIEVVPSQEKRRNSLYSLRAKARRSVTFSVVLDVVQPVSWSIGIEPDTTGVSSTSSNRSSNTSVFSTISDEPMEDRLLMPWTDATKMIKRNVTTSAFPSPIHSASKSPKSAMKCKASSAAAQSNILTPIMLVNGFQTNAFVKGWIRVMTHGSKMNKYSHDAIQQRVFSVNRELTKLNWKQTRSSESMSSELLSDVDCICYGVDSSARFSRYDELTGKPWLCFTLHLKHRTVDLECENETQLTCWFMGLQALTYDQLRNTLRIGALLWRRMTMKIRQRACAKNCSPLDLVRLMLRAAFDSKHNPFPSQDCKVGKYPAIDASVPYHEPPKTCRRSSSDTVSEDNPSTSNTAAGATPKSQSMLGRVLSWL